MGGGQLTEKMSAQMTGSNVAVSFKENPIYAIEAKEVRKDHIPGRCAHNSTPREKKSCSFCRVSHIKIRADARARYSQGRYSMRVQHLSLHHSIQYSKT